jgi:peptide/nickel transport system permease protein
MLAYITRRLLYMIPIILGVALLVFSLFSSVGEDPVRLALGTHATPEAIAALEAKWGLDQPFYVQFFRFLKQIVTLDFGRSFVTGESMGAMIANGAIVSLTLTLPPFIAGLFLFVGCGILIAYFRGSWFDRFSTFFFVAALSVSYLVYIIAFQYIFAYKLDLFPINGFEHGWGAVEFLALPWIIILVVSAGADIRLYRTVFLDETKADYVRTAFAKGCTNRAVLFKHILKNAMIPILTYTVIAIPFLILGAFLMERFFSLPGIGDMIITAINNGDFPIIKGVTIFIAIGYAFANLVTDVMYAFVDPRVKLS